MNMHASCTDAHFLRRRLDLARLQASARPRILAITHRQGGGVERHLQDMSRILREDVEILSLAQGGDDNMRLRWLRTGEEDFSLWYRMPEALPGLIELLRRLQIGRVHVHHVLEIPRCIMDLPDSLDLPWDFTVHDHYPICPQFNLGDEHGRYCGEKGSADCARCLSVRPAPWGLDIASWRALFAHWLRGAQRVFVPSMDTLERMRRYIPTANYLLLPHPEPAPSTTSLDLSDTQPGTNRSMALPRGFDPPWAKGRDRAYKVLLLGVMNPAKGLDLLGRCARDARERHLPLEYCVLGWFMNPLHGIEQLAVSCTGPYAYSDIQTLIAAERADVLMFPFQVPETWSYTLGEGLASGLPLIASALGAIPERLAGRPDAVLLSPEATGNQWNDAIMKLLESRT